MIEPIRKPTQPTTAAGPLDLDRAVADMRKVLPTVVAEIERRARGQDGSALRLLRMAAPRLAVGGAATDAWLFEVRAFLKTAALPPSAPPALDPCPHCEQVVLTDGEHWVPNGGGWSCARLEQDP